MLTPSELKMIQLINPQLCWDRVEDQQIPCLQPVKKLSFPAIQDCYLSGARELTKNEEDDDKNNGDFVTKLSFVINKSRNGLRKDEIAFFSAFDWTLTPWEWSTRCIV